MRLLARPPADEKDELVARGEGITICGTTGPRRSGSGEKPLALFDGTKQTQDCGGVHPYRRAGMAAADQNREMRF